MAGEPKLTDAERLDSLERTVAALIKRLDRHLGVPVNEEMHAPRLTPRKTRAELDRDEHQ
jgi:hypothetical protein